MKKTITRLIVITACLCALLPSFTAISRGSEADTDTLSYSKFGKVFIYRQTPQPSHVVLFVSGDGGWNLGVVDMARTLSSLDALVVGIDITRYLRTLQNASATCLYPAEDFELLSKFIQQKYNYSVYTPPVLIGYSSGATLVYAILVQAPPQTFLGAVSMGFCPDLLLTRPMCKGNGLEWTIGPKNKGYIFSPASNLEAPWVVLIGTEDQVCTPGDTEDFVKKVKNGKLIVLPKVGHGFAVPRNWMPQFKDAFAEIVTKKEAAAQPASDALKDLPIEEVPAQNPSARLQSTVSDCMAVFVSGDGGWGVTDKGVSGELAARGIPVAGLNSLHYFWKPKSPEIVSKDLARILSYYMPLWKKNKVILIGYSMGADVLPFMITGLPPDIRNRIELAAFIGPSSTADFEFHLSNWLKNSSRKTSREVLPELRKLKGMKMLFFNSEDDKESLREGLDSSFGRIVQLKGGHRVGGNFAPIVDEVLKAME